MRSIVWFLPAFFVFLGILLLSTVFSVPVQIEGVSYLDKIEHAFAYLVLTISFLYGFYKNQSLKKSTWILLMVLCALYGTTLELIQYTFFPNRYFEWLDATANLAGVLLGGFSFIIFTNGQK
ncbi:MAG: VanZ family protein [Cyclobacteriaceae bacterium]